MSEREHVRGQVMVSLAIVAVILLPLGYHVVAAVAGGAGDPEPFLERPDPAVATECVRPVDYMRFHHWELLLRVREEVVRYGIRGDVTRRGVTGEVSLRKCQDCHASRERFCDRCHEKVSMTPDCFGCHHYGGE